MYLASTIVLGTLLCVISVTPTTAQQNSGCEVAELNNCDAQFGGSRLMSLTQRHIFAMMPLMMKKDMSENDRTKTQRTIDSLCNSITPFFTCITTKAPNCELDGYAATAPLLLRLCENSQNMMREENCGGKEGTQQVTTLQSRSLTVCGTLFPRLAAEMQNMTKLEKSRTSDPNQIMPNLVKSFKKKQAHLGEVMSQNCTEFFEFVGCGISEYQRLCPKGNATRAKDMYSGIITLTEMKCDKSITMDIMESMFRKAYENDDDLIDAEVAEATAAALTPESQPDSPRPRPTGPTTTEKELLTLPPSESFNVENPAFIIVIVLAVIFVILIAVVVICLCRRHGQESADSRDGATTSGNGRKMRRPAGAPSLASSRASSHRSSVASLTSVSTSASSRAVSSRVKRY